MNTLFFSDQKREPKIYFNQNQYQFVVERLDKICFTWSHIITRFDVSSKPSFETTNDKESEVQLNVISPSDTFMRRRHLPVFAMVGKEAPNPYKKKPNIYDDDDELFEDDISSIELIVLSFLESNPFNGSVLFIGGKRTLLSDTNALTMECVLPRYKHFAITLNTLSTLYLSFRKIRKPADTRFITRSNSLIDNYKEMLFLKRLNKILESDDYNEDDLDKLFSDYNDNKIFSDNDNDNDNDRKIGLKKYKYKKDPISIKDLEVMLNINVRIITNSYFKHYLEVKYFNIRWTNEIFTKAELHSSNSCPQKDMSKKNQKTSMFKERLLFGTVLESYHYLLYFYLLHNSEYVQLKRDLIKQGAISL
jgi:hypothetical protein